MRSWLAGWIGVVPMLVAGCAWHSVRAVPVELVREEVVVDGRADEGFWSRVPRRALTRFDGAPTRQTTEFQVAATAAHLLFFFHVQDSDLRAPLEGRDAEIWRGDVVEVLIAPGGELSTYYEFSTAPNGACYDARVVSPKLERAGMEVDPGWDAPGWQSAVWATAEGWAVEWVIPRAELGDGLGSAGRMNVHRIDITPELECQAWGVLPRADFHLPEYFVRFRCVEFAAP